MPFPSSSAFPSLGTFPGGEWARSIDWSKDDRYYLHGLDRGVLYIPGKNPVPWNGLTGVDENSDASTSILYRDGRIYCTDVDPGDFQGSLTAYFYPDEFSECLGIPSVTPGFYVDNQKPKPFNLSYRNLIGSGHKGDRFGYQIHLIYNAMATIGTRSRKTLTDQPDLTELSFDLVATPVQIPGMRPSAHYIIDTRYLDEATILKLELILYGYPGFPGHLPEPEDLYDMLEFGNSITFIDHGDGTWTARGSSDYIVQSGETWTISNVNGTDHGDGTYTLVDTP